MRITGRQNCTGISIRLISGESGNSVLTILPFLLQLVNFPDAGVSVCTIEATGGKIVFDPCVYCQDKGASRRGGGTFFLHQFAKVCCLP
jgi:hypothetical protein